MLVFKLFFYKIVLATVCFLNFEILDRLANLGKNQSEIFLEILLNLWVNLVNTDIVIIFSLLVHERSMSFHLLISSLFSFSNVFFCFQNVYLHLFC